MSIRTSAIGLATVVVLMSAGAAQSLSGSNTVTSDDIVDGQITSADVKNNAIYGADIYPGRRIVSAARAIPAFADAAYGSVDCPAGTTLTGGGFRASTDDLYVLSSYPSDANTWTIAAGNWDDEAAHAMYVFAVCDAL